MYTEKLKMHVSVCRCQSKETNVRAMACVFFILGTLPFASLQNNTLKATLVILCPFGRKYQNTRQHKPVVCRRLKLLEKGGTSELTKNNQSLLSFHSKVYRKWITEGCLTVSLCLKDFYRRILSLAQASG